MSEADSWAFLHSFWGESELRETICCECLAAIDTDQAFARTFSLVDESKDSTTSLPYAKLIEAPRVQRTIRVLYRHLECLYKSTPFVAVSHVWDRPIAELQHKHESKNRPLWLTTKLELLAQGRLSSLRKRMSDLAFRREKGEVSASEVVDLVCNVPAQVAIALEDALGAEGKLFEIWHDYLSVPQWSRKAKAAIISNISELFRKATMTVICLNDVEASAFDAMRSGASKDERCRAIGQICAAEWYSRMWTMMEQTESANMIILAKGLRPVAPDELGRVLIDELIDRWRDELRAHVLQEKGIPRDLDEIVWSSKGLVPWCLGTNLTRSDSLAGRRPNFGLVHADFSRRRVTVPKDFFHAFEAVLKTGYELDSAIEDRPNDVMHGIAMRRILSGDLSPLFMVPTSAHTNFKVREGYTDLTTFGLGREEEPHGCKTIKAGTSPRQVVISAEEVGVFQYARRFHWVGHYLGPSMRIALDASGLDIDTFVDTVGVRLYGQNRDVIYRRLIQDGRRRQLQERLCSFYDNVEGGHNGPIVDRIADLIGLKIASLGEAVERLVFIEHHGNVLHHGQSGAIVGIKCTKCHRIFPIRILLYQPVSTLLGVKAYRIPGLKYQFSHAGGVGILLLRHRIVGRFIWGTPTCECPKMTEIEVTIHDLPLPEPNNSRYQ